MSIRRAQAITRRSSASTEQLAFSGGMDVAGGRWDTSEHRAQDPRRGYPPSHDVQAMVDGDAAAALVEIVRDRWRRATGELIPDPEPGSDPWPEDVPGGSHRRGRRHLAY